MIVYTHSFGRLGNQLWTHAHLLAFALDRELSFLSTNLRPYRNWYDGNGQRSILGKPFREIAPDRGVSLFAGLAYSANLRTHSAPVVALAEGELFDLDQSPSFDALVDDRPVVFLSGLFFMASEAIDRHAETVRAWLTPRASVVASVEARMAGCRARWSHHVAVHIRRGDYRTSSQGDMFYTDAEYAVAMRCIAAQLGESTLFHLFSDELVDVDSFRPLNIEPWNGNAAADIHAMSRCDFILGPYSSYSQWASFAGRTPLHALNWKAWQRDGTGPVIREPSLASDFQVFAPAEFGRFATRTVGLEEVLERRGKWM